MVRFNTGVQRVYRWEDVEVTKSFTVDLGNVTIPIARIRGIIELHFTDSGNYGYSGFNKISAIKAVRQHFGVRDEDGNTYGTFIGLRDAKEMVEEAYREGINDGNYHVTVPYYGGAPVPDDDLPF